MRHLYGVYIWEKTTEIQAPWESVSNRLPGSHKRTAPTCAASQLSTYNAHEMAIIHLGENNPFPANGHNKICTRYIIQRKTLALQRPSHHDMKEKRNRNEYAHDCILVTSCSLLDFFSSEKNFFFWSKNFIMLDICPKKKKPDMECCDASCFNPIGLMLW